MAIRGAIRGAAIAALAAVILFVSYIHDFLAINESVRANVLVVEGCAWQSAAMQEAAEEFHRGRYDVAITVGVLSGTRQREVIQENDAALAAEQLEKLRIDINTIVILAIPNIERHRT
jgi:hypothetical protein